MNGLDAVIRQLEQQSKAIEKALTALRGVEGIPASGPRRGRPPKAAAKQGGMTEAGRQRLRDAMKRRWAAKRKGTASKKSPKKTSRLTPEGRQRLAESMRKRWAVKRAGSTVKKRRTTRKTAAKNAR